VCSGKTKENETLFVKGEFLVFHFLYGSDLNF